MLWEFPVLPLLLLLSPLWKAACICTSSAEAEGLMKSSRCVSRAMGTGSSSTPGSQWPAAAPQAAQALGHINKARDLESKF